MGRLWLAFSAFFRVLSEKALADRVGEILSEEPQAPLPEEKPQKPKEAKPARAPARSEAITFLAALQREARFVDFIQEPIDGYNDAQIGAAVREVHRQCGAVMERFFDLQPVLQQEEASDVEIPADFDAARFRLSGDVAGEPPYQGKLVHHGWVAKKCQLPEWSGNADSARIVAPAEVEVK